MMGFCKSKHFADIFQYFVFIHGSMSRQLLVFCKLYKKKKKKSIKFINTAKTTEFTLVH